VATAAAIDDRPCAFRYPRGNGSGVEMPAQGIPLEIGRGRVLREGTSVALLSYGCRLQECLAAADELQARGLSTTVADARFAKPIDEDLISRLARDHEILVTIEEAACGGFSAQVMTYLAGKGAFDAGLKFRPMMLPDRFIAHGTPDGMYLDAGLVAPNITKTVLDALGLGNEAVHIHG
jgi:1-deoxy-D-xylulose-5-phosphate synthase